MIEARKVVTRPKLPDRDKFCRRRRDSLERHHAEGRYPGTSGDGFGSALTFAPAQARGNSTNFSVVSRDSADFDILNFKAVPPAIFPVL
ncbi:hypothetical protein KQX54_005966 [Cotesia glomerata]|uniref:Uncharacterized protein n=1 Tax=Cotesia glomerata TaxID=32391 RepID=A0AAV7I9F6_COTGL|nr:hypothetical protein KQX54_005966 [Cotesia glomerata]